jgi:V/A-type H+-transporting ATPase subunit E
MEELRSTEILIKEIQEDARKTAEKTLESADEECKAILAEVDGNVRQVIEQRKAEYAEKTKSFRQDKEASLPLEKKRYLVLFEGNAVAKAINDYLSSLSQKDRLKLLEGLLSAYAPVAGKRPVKALAFGIPKASAEDLLKKTFGAKSVAGCEEIIFEKTGEVPVDGISIREGIILETEDGAIRMRATLDELILELLDAQRYELTSTLFGGRLPE